MPTTSPKDEVDAMETSSGPSPDSNADFSNTPSNSTPRDVAAGPQPGVSHSASGTTVIDPDVEPSATLNPRSCVTCRRRKVRCDKHMPCGNCRRARISCVFPAPGRAPRRPRPKDPNAPPKQSSEREVELIKRLRKLEGIVEELSGQIEVDARHPSSAGDSPEETTEDAEKRRQASSTTNYTPPAGYPALPPAPERLMRADTSNYGTLQSPSPSMNKDFGRLVLNDKGRSRYVSNAFWSKLNDELSEIRAETQRLTDDDSNDSGDESSPEALSPDKALQTDHHAFILGYRSSDVDLRDLHPLPSQIPFIWQIYTENVDPLVKILHVPTVNNVIKSIRKDMNSMTPAWEALMFSIYYAAITSMEEDEVMTNFGKEKSHLINKYRYGTEQALAKASFLTNSDIVVIQAFAIFLVLVRRYDDTRFSWTLTGLIIRISQSIGAHREGTQFGNLTPFEIEMRRRLWWSICILDLRSAEDQGTELTIAEHTYDTELPLNINDADIHPEMKEFPRARTGATDMTFCLIRYEICSLARRLHAASNPMAPCPKDAQWSLQQREELLLDMYRRVENRYLKPCTADGNVLHWVAAAIARLIMAKMSLIIYQPVLFPGPEQEVSSEVRNRLFVSSTEVVEYNRLLNTEPKCKQYRWLFQTYTQWHAVAYLLLEICRRPWSSSVERAWLALNAVFSDSTPQEWTKLAQHGAAWLPLRKLMIKAKHHREKELARLRADPQAARQLDTDSAQTPPASFEHLPQSVRETIAQDRWRKLVGLPNPEKQHVPGCFDNPNIEPTPAPNAGTQTPGQPQMSQSNLDYIGSVMSNPVFNPADFWSVAFNSNPDDLARQAMYGNGLQTRSLADQQQPPALSISSNGSPLTSKGGIAFPRDEVTGPLSATRNTTTTQVPQSGFPTTSAGLVDDTPPWLWAEPFKWEPNLTADAPVTADDTDINMEEDFNWQDWQQSMRGYELDAGLGVGMNGAGFSGGI